MAALYQLVSPDGRLLSLSPVRLQTNEGTWVRADAEPREPFRNAGPGSLPRQRVLTIDQYRAAQVARFLEEVAA